MTHKQAKAAGIKAQQAGLESAPCHNGEFLQAACESKNDTCRLFDSYRAGWQLAADVATAEELKATGHFDELPSVLTLDHLKAELAAAA